MLALAVTRDKQLVRDFKVIFSSMNSHVIHYRNPLKAMDNLPEIQPDVILFSAIDFPRHWKLCIRDVRDLKSREEGIFILYTEKDFPTEEADKAAFLQVNAILSEALPRESQFQFIEKLLQRYRPQREVRREEVFIAPETERLEFLFLNPQNYQMITGRLMDLSQKGGSFKPDDPPLVHNLEEGMVIEPCSLRLGGDIISLTARIKQKGGMLLFEFQKFQPGGREILTSWLNKTLKGED